MRYFRIFDDISEEGGDLYRWDGTVAQMRLTSGVYSDHTDAPHATETLEEFFDSLSGTRGRWEEVGCPDE